MTDKKPATIESTVKNSEENSEESISHDKTTHLITNPLKSEFHLPRNEHWDKPKKSEYFKIAIRQCLLFAGGLFFVLLFLYPRHFQYMALYLPYRAVELVFLILNIKGRGG